MTRIKKAIATECAIQLLQERAHAIKLQKQELDSIALEIYMDNMPDCMKETMNKFRDYIVLSDEVKFMTALPMTNRVAFRIATPMPYSGAYLLISRSDYDRIMRVREGLSKLEYDYAVLLTDTIGVLMRLRTRENVLREFPSLDKFIPETKPSAPVSLDSVKKILG